VTAGRLTAGAAKADVTPADLTGLNPMGGSFDRVLDPLSVRALVVGDGATRCALIAVDLIEVGDTKEIRRRIQRETGIAADHVLIAPTHSHNAPRIGHVPPGGKAREPSPESLVYTETVYDAMVATTLRARDTARPARIGLTHGTVDVNVNREQYVDGRWVLGQNPDGPSDKTLTVVELTAETGERIAVVLNYAVHSTVLLGLPHLSADLAGAASAHVESELGEDVVALWTSGALGDQAPRVSLGTPTGDPERDRTTAHGAARAQGLLVGATAVQALGTLDRRTAAVAVTGGERVIACPVRRSEVPEGMVQADVDTVELTLSCVTVGGVAFTGVSGEVTVPVHQALTEASPLAATLMVSNANARIGYLPTDEAYDRRTPAAEGSPILRGHAQDAIVEGLLDLVSAALAPR
jgi:hypothetical protein